MTTDFLTLGVFAIFFGIWSLIQIKLSKDRSESNRLLIKMLGEEHKKEIEKLQQDIKRLEDEIKILQSQKKCS